MHAKDALTHNSPLRGGMHRRTHSRTPSRPAHNTHQHTCTPASPPAEMDGEAAKKHRRLEPKPHPTSLDFISSLPDDMLLVIIGLLPTKSAVRTTLLSQRWSPSGAASPSTSLPIAASVTGIANAWPQSPRSFHRTLGQPDTLTSACSVPTARSNPSSMSGSYPPP